MLGMTFVERALPSATVETVFRSVALALRSSSCAVLRYRPLALGLICPIKQLLLL